MPTSNYSENGEATRSSPSRNNTTKSHPGHVPDTQTERQKKSRESALSVPSSSPSRSKTSNATDLPDSLYSVVQTVLQYERSSTNLKVSQSQTKHRSVSNASMKWISLASKTDSAQSGQSHKRAEPSLALTKKKGAVLTCVKCSPRIIPRPCPSIEMYEYEAKQWQAAFDTMGKLFHTSIPDILPKHVINKIPYHCDTQGRVFEAKYGDLNLVPSNPKSNQDDVAHPWCSKLRMTTLPVARPLPKPQEIPRGLLEGAPRKLPHYLPKSSVRVRWPHKTRFKKSLTDSDICGWMQTFGIVLFTMPEGPNCMVVTFEDMISADKAVRRIKTTPPGPGIMVSWVDSQYANYANFIINKNYRVSTDSLWQQGLRRQPVHTTAGQQSIRRKTLVLGAAAKHVDTEKELHFAN